MPASADAREQRRGGAAAWLRAAAPSTLLAAPSFWPPSIPVTFPSWLQSSAPSILSTPHSRLPHSAQLTFLLSSFPFLPPLNTTHRRYAKKYADGKKEIDAEIAELKKHCSVIRVLAHTQARQRWQFWGGCLVRGAACAPRRRCLRRLVPRRAGRSTPNSPPRSLRRAPPPHVLPALPHHN